MKKLKGLALAGLVVAVGIVASAGILIAQYAPGTNYIEQGATRTVIQGSLDVVSGAELDIESGGAFEIGGTAVSLSATEFDDFTVEVVIPDISTAGTWHVVSHFAGTITDWYCVLNGAITGEGSTLTLSVDSSTITTGGSLTVTFVGSASGDIDSDTTVDGGNTVSVGSIVSINTDGGSTGAIQETCTIVIDR